MPSQRKMSHGADRDINRDIHHNVTQDEAVEPEHPRTNDRADRVLARVDPIKLRRVERAVDDQNDDDGERAVQTPAMLSLMPAWCRPQRLQALRRARSARCPLPAVAPRRARGAVL